MSELDICGLKEKTLILTQTDPDTDMMFKAWGEAGLNAAIIFKPIPKLWRGVRRIWADGILPGCQLWYGEWKNNIEKYDTVIIHADVRTRTVPQFIHKVKPSMRIIYWYWNPVCSRTLPSLTKDNQIECWSFDSNDCNTYRMKKNIQYYYCVQSFIGLPIEYDIYFVGHDKGRREEIDKLINLFSLYNLSSRLDLLKESDPIIPYQVVQKRISKCKAILEVNQSGQVGYTLRALEALFYEKKLITTNQLIEKEPFYRPENIFIIGKDDIREIGNFMNTEMKDVSQYKNQFDIDTWFTNFFREEYV